MSELSELYQEVILDHNKNPRNFREIENADKTADGKNPLCGDEITLHVRFGDKSIDDVSFSGRGCSISQASASMMTQLLKGRGLDEVDELRTKFRDMVMGDQGLAEDKSLGSLRALSGVARFPARVKCALLAWNALEAALSEKT